MRDNNPYLSPASEHKAAPVHPRGLRHVVWVLVVLVLAACFALVGVSCLLYLGTTWGDPKGGASGNLPPVLTTADRLSRSCIPAGILLVQLIAVLIGVRYVVLRFRRETK